jgi:hypothetical protein
MKLLKLMVLGLLSLTCAAQTTVTGTIADQNGNPYSNGTASAFAVVATGQVSPPSVNTTTNITGFFSMSLPANTYTFTICAAPTSLGPTSNPTPKQVCFTSLPIAISGSSQDVSAQLNPSATIIGPAAVGKLQAGNNGSSGAPSISFLGAPDEGFYVAPASTTYAATSAIRTSGVVTMTFASGILPSFPGSVTFTASGFSDSSFNGVFHTTSSTATTLVYPQVAVDSSAINGVVQFWAVTAVDYGLQFNRLISSSSNTASKGSILFGPRDPIRNGCVSCSASVVSGFGANNQNMLAPQGSSGPLQVGDYLGIQIYGPFTTAITGGGTQCAQIGNTGLVTGTGAPCAASGGGGTVTSVATTAPLTGGPITVSGTISITNNGIGATQLASQYSKLRCVAGLGDGLNAIPAGTYLQSTCYNDSAATWTITGLKCFTDNNGTSTVNAAGNTLGALLTGALTCTNSFAAGTQSANVALTAGDYIKFTFVADGTSKQTTWVVSMTQ